MIVPQNRKVDKYLGGQIIGESQSNNGEKQIVIDYKTESK